MARIVGTSGNDVLRGTSHRDVIIGKGGNDKIIGRGGNDKLKGGKGNDKIKGKSGNDKLIGGKGKDKLIGGNGNDKLNGGAGNDKLDAGKGDDTLSGGKGNDTLDAGPGVDDIFGGLGADIFRFELGDGQWPNFPFSPPIPGRVDNIVFDYQDGIDKFDVPEANIVPTSGFEIDDPVGGDGAAFIFGPLPGFNDPQTTAVFVAGVILADFDELDFI